MKQTTKNKTLIFVWILVLGVYAFLYLFNNSMPVWKKWLVMTMWTATALLNTYGAIRNNKDFTLTDDVLIIRQIFLKEQQYSLKTVAEWVEYNYKFLGFSTGRKIILKTMSGTKINLLDDDSKDFEKVLDYLNTNLADKFSKII